MNRLKIVMLLLTISFSALISGCGFAVNGNLGSVLSVSPGTVDFGLVSIGELANTTVALVNSSPIPVDIQKITVAGQSFSLADTEKLPIHIPAGGSHTVSLSFTPTNSTDFSGELTMLGTSAQPMAQVPMRGRGKGPTFSVNTSSLDFGNVALNTAVVKTVTLTSTAKYTTFSVNSASTTGSGFSVVGGSFPINLSPGQSTTLQVQFKPTVNGTASGLMSFTSSSSNTNLPVVSLSGTGTGSTPPPADPKLTVSAASLAYGSVTVNTAATKTVTLTSSGTSAVTVNSASITGAGFSILSGTLPATLTPGQSVTLTVQFKPTTAAALTGQITVSSNSTTGTTSTVALSGTGTAAANPKLTVSAASLAYGSVTVNTAATKTVTLTSSGTSAVTVNSASITGAGFSILSGTLPATLTPGQTVTLTVQFNPTTAAALTGQITISSNSTSGSTSTVALTGTGTAAANPKLTVSAASLAYGSVTVNTAATKTVTLTSSGTSAVTVNSASITGAGFSILSGTLPATLTPGQTVTLTVQFNPTTATALTGQITVSSNSTTGSTSTVALSGTGTAAANPKLTVSVTTLSFGSLDVDLTTTKTVTLTSSGTSAVTVNSASITGAGFSILSGTLPATLTPGQTVTVTVQFAPTTTGSLTGQLTISSNSTSGSTATVALSGTGTAASHEVDLFWNPPSSSTDPVVGYNVYRAIGTGSYSLLNSTPIVAPAYVDTAVVSGATYNYMVKSVDSVGMESTASNTTSATIP
jgi:Abnormal spindle-like microcephaly-assoc'd, ASPM-SPD-2-Hydin